MNYAQYIYDESASIISDPLLKEQNKQTKMGFSQTEGKKIVDACLQNILRIVKGKSVQEEKIEELKLQMDLIDAVVKDTDKKKKKKSKKRKLSDNDSTSSVEIVEPSK